MLSESHTGSKVASEVASGISHGNGGDPEVTHEAICQIQRKVHGRRKLNHAIRRRHMESRVGNEALCRETLQLMADGIGIAEIAGRLGKNYYCLKNHLKRFYDNHGLENAYMAIGRGFREGWIK